MTRVDFTLNDSPVSWEGPALARLLDVLRDELGCTGVKCGCREGECGTCSVLLDGALVNSCLVAMGAVTGRTVLTIEGYRRSERFAALDTAYARHGAVQCGDCTPGMILASEALLASNPHPSEEQIRTALSGNLCRCTGYNSIVAAVSDAARDGGSLWELPGEKSVAQAGSGLPLAGSGDAVVSDAGAAAGDSDVAVSGASATPTPSATAAAPPAALTLSDALRLRDEQQALPYAGGTDLMVAGASAASAGKDAAATQAALFLNNIPELKGIREDAENLYIGAACTYSQLLDDPRTPAVLREAISQIAAPAIRNVATIGGNIANASPKADSALILYAADAQLRLQSAHGQRDVALGDFIRGRGQTSLGPDELLCEIILPKAHLGNYRYQKIGARKALAISRVSFVGLFAEEDGVIKHLAVAFGAVADTVIRRPEIDASLIGCTLAEARERKDAWLAAWEDAIVPVAGRVSAEYRKTVCLNLLRAFISEQLG
ncbi:MAG: FAD binding domain-containing protein [Coriobacteriales bacterium]|jgi:xanthine dehydrogenase iron-sulfur cluster and FAD-binding subunit A|nr:FAD binding domain-containing protein [Coriobacteriales bacterium]